MNVLGWTAKEGESPVVEMLFYVMISIPSTAEHVEFRGNLPRPWGKAKY